MRRVVGIAAVILFVACGTTAPVSWTAPGIGGSLVAPPDARPDGGTTGPASGDAGGPDAAREGGDAGSRDGGSGLAGSADAGPAHDAGSADASLSCPVLSSPDAGESLDAAVLTGTVPVVLHVESPSSNPLQPFVFGVDGSQAQDPSSTSFDGGVDLAVTMPRSQLDALQFGLVFGSPSPVVWAANFQLGPTLEFLAIDNAAVVSITVVLHQAPAPSFAFGVGPIEVALSDGGIVTTPQETPDPPADGTAPLTNQNGEQWVPVIYKAGLSWSQASVALSVPPPACALLSLEEQVVAPDVSATELLECPLWLLPSLTFAGFEVHATSGVTAATPGQSLGPWLQKAGACPAQIAWVQFDTSNAVEMPGSEAVIQMEAVLDDGATLTASQNLPGDGDAGG